eukprot:SAG31_NODE_17_length_35773_cov_25.999271_1_plen_127_part_10
MWSTCPLQTPAKQQNHTEKMAVFGTYSQHQSKSHSNHPKNKAQTTNAMQAVATLTEAYQQDKDHSVWHSSELPLVPISLHSHIFSSLQTPPNARLPARALLCTEPRTTAEGPDQRAPPHGHNKHGAS